MKPHRAVLFALAGIAAGSCLGFLATYLTMLWGSDLVPARNNLRLLELPTVIGGVLGGSLAALFILSRR